MALEPREQVFALLLLQRLELFPEASFASQLVVFFLQSDHSYKSIAHKFCTDTNLQFFDATVNAAGVDSGGVEGLLQVHNGAAGLHHWVFLVVLDQVGQTDEALAATNVKFAVLKHKMKWFVSWIQV